MIFAVISLLALFGISGCANGDETSNKKNASEDSLQSVDTLRYPGETRLRNLRQLTFGGDNAEAYFSFDNKELIFQRTHKQEGPACDQIFLGAIPANPGDPFEYKLVSTGQGRTTCAYFLHGNQRVLYASTHLGGADCPPEPDRSVLKKYLWPIYDTYEIFISDREGNILHQLTDNKFYDAEATVSPKEDLIVFTSNRSGDLELWTVRPDGSELNQITFDLGYDGGAFFSPDGSKLVFRASRPKTEEEVTEYKELLTQGLVAPTNMEIYVCNIDGSGLRQVTNLGKANWAPFFHPSGEKILFSSNHKSERGFPFNIFMINLDGTGLEQITFDKDFDAFPMFSFDGKHLIFSSNRKNGGTRDTNLFLAEWVD